MAALTLPLRRVIFIQERIDEYKSPRISPFEFNDPQSIFDALLCRERSIVPTLLDTARTALALAKNAGQQTATTTLLMEAIEALIEHQSELALRQGALAALPADTVRMRGSFGIDIS